ncbi:MAG: hypothetical protein A3G32_09520 [Deltaproteobacteria bacterium RIFCSPLOWO2_12_FULL_40_28]|nr:MAG: hypothetical protein A3C45_07790 [Deltaproteobacteria bacterium RIFCSPHIGHO2_02_FULL_40_28]OGQ20519.1 MAG: hypothetical protein A3E27_02580 [Deltaproteobacteria bacterium RIFCSPHIGHO2_12_FULL_40_32]OGQ41170.1 MAG: hypothetical protein A3I69_07815 [Deltaproteobacteria bacterium RIFCSPLOWO2_02_FULL_40_36]OGQ55132.1 MAG: hypothetical protein A3G32_09520 [Deltaproteobacteria bacterium RIFCSPLOWO2_12_FULL_40_28]
MKVNSLTSTASHLILNRPTIPVRGGEGREAPKTIGETPPILVDPSTLGNLAIAFGPTGLITRLKKRLNYLRRKKCRVVPAKGTTACVDDNDVVYLGVDFVANYLDEAETIAGVMAHEWGHACALKPRKDDLQKLSWDHIFALRRAHETLADEISGRLLCIMGYTPNGLIKFLTRGGKTHNLKYHNPEIRARVVQYGFECEKRKAALSRKLFDKSVYPNQYSSILLDIV